MWSFNLFTFQPKEVDATIKGTITEWNESKQTKKLKQYEIKKNC